MSRSDNDHDHTLIPKQARCSVLLSCYDHHRDSSTELCALSHSTLDSLNPQLLTVQYAVRGELAIKADALSKIQDARPWPALSDKVISSNIGNPQQKGLDQPPINFTRQVPSVPTTLCPPAHAVARWKSSSPTNGARRRDRLRRRALSQPGCAVYAQECAQAESACALLSPSSTSVLPSASG